MSSKTVAAGGSIHWRALVNEMATIRSLVDTLSILEFAVRLSSVNNVVAGQKTLLAGTDETSGEDAGKDKK